MRLSKDLGKLLDILAGKDEDGAYAVAAERALAKVEDIREAGFGLPQLEHFSREGWLCVFLHAETGELLPLLIKSAPAGTWITEFKEKLANVARTREN